MERRKRGFAPGVGKLPALAPLANPYVPYQMEDPARYEAEQGLVRGTLYPGLDLPFMGMVNRRPLHSSLMSELQATAFAIQELALYLDTHREDAEALALYRQYQKMYQEQCKAYTCKHGPLCHTELNEKPEYEWLCDPWPWEYCGNKEV